MIVMMEDWQEGRADTHTQPVRTASKKCEIKNEKAQNQKLGFRSRADTSLQSQKTKVENYKI